MTRSSLKDRVANLEQIRGISLVHSGSPADVRLSALGDVSKMRAMAAIAALCRRGVGAHVAKMVVEQLVEIAAGEGQGPIDVHVPRVESQDSLTNELAKAGIVVRFLVPA
jgi:hypothetical protein